MSIVASVIVEDAEQVDGRRHIRERHTDHLGRHHEVFYVGAANEDEQANLTARVSQIETNLADAEFSEVVG